jgi:hypothetical protein
VFQAYLTTFLIEPGYVEPIKTVDQMLASDMKFGFFQDSEPLFTDTSDSTHTTILKKAVCFTDYITCPRWAIYYHNISTILDDLNKVLMQAAGIWTDENNRPLICELEYGGVETSGIAFLVSQGSPLLEFINDVISHIVEGGIFLHIRNRELYKTELQIKYVSPTFADTYSATNITHLQMVFYLLLLGYAVAVACFVAENLWHLYR